MNKQRLARLKEVKDMIQEAKDTVEELQREEEECFENLPENFQNSDKGDQMQEYIEAFEQIDEFLDSAVCTIKDL